jgi:DNA gyrase subunit A
VVSAVVANVDGRSELLTVSENGFGKRTTLDLYRPQTRGGKGIINMKVTDKTGPVLGAMMVDPEEEVILLTSGNKIIRISVAGISIVGRATQGVRLVRLDPGGQVVCFDLYSPEVIDE